MGTAVSTAETPFSYICKTDHGSIASLTNVDLRRGRGYGNPEKRNLLSQIYPWKSLEPLGTAFPRTAIDAVFIQGKTYAYFGNVVGS